MLRNIAWAALMLATAVSSACNLDLPPGCGKVLVTRNVAAACLSDGRCEYVEQDPSYVARWTLRIEDAGFSAGEMDKRRNCVADYLDNRGILVLDRGTDDQPWVIAEGIAQNFDEVLEFTPVANYLLGCSGGVCEQCAGLDEAQCMADAFCLSSPPGVDFVCE